MPFTFTQDARSTMLPIAGVFCRALLAAAAPVAATGYEFTLIEPLPSPGITECYASGINNNNVVVGTSTSGSFYQGYSWTEDGGQFALPNTTGAGIIDDQNRVLLGGALLDAMTGDVVRSFSGLPGIFKAFNANDIGVGHTPSGGSPGCEPFDCPYDCADPFIWTEADGAEFVTTIPGLKALTDINDSNIAIGQAVFTCDDEQGIVLNVDTGEWTNLSDFLPPLDLVGRDAQTIPVDINNNGDVVGLALFGSEPQQIFVWNQASGFTFLPAIQNGELGYMFPTEISDAGLVVGSAQEYDVVGDPVAFVWNPDPEIGMRIVRDVVGDAPADFLITRANGINENGWIVGHGHFGPGWGVPYGFVLKPVAPQFLASDLNQDGVVDTFDLLMMLDAWGTCPATPECPGDMNNDNVVDTFDLLQLLEQWG